MRLIFTCEVCNALMCFWMSINRSSASPDFSTNSQRFLRLDSSHWVSLQHHKNRLIRYKYNSISMNMHISKMEKSL